MQDFPAKWIYEPWKAPIADQKHANCRIGVDYPKPMVDHASVSKDNIQKLKDAYADQSPSKAKSPPHAKSPPNAKAPSHAKAASGGSQAHARQQQGAHTVGMQTPTCMCSGHCIGA